MSAFERSGRWGVVVALLAAGGAARGQASPRPVAARVGEAQRRLIQTSFDSIAAVLRELPAGHAHDSAAYALGEQMIARLLRPDDLVSTGALLAGWSGLVQSVTDVEPLCGLLDESLGGFEPTDTSRAARAYAALNMGTYYVTRGRYRDARIALDSAIAVPQARGETAGRAHYQLGYMAYYRADYRRASRHLELAAASFALDGDLFARTISCLDAAGSCAFELGEYDRSLDLTRRAVRRIERLAPEIRRSGGLRRTTHTAFLNFAESLQLAGEVDSTTHYLEIGLAIARSLGDPYHLAVAQTVAGRIATRSGRLAEAEGALDSALAAFDARGAVDLAQYARRSQVDLRRAQGRLPEALDLLTEYYERQDSLTRSQVNRDIDAVRASREIDRERHATAILRQSTLRLEAENRSQRLAQLGLWGLVALLSVASAYGLHRYRARSRAQARLEALVAERTAELSEQAAELRRSNAELERFAYIASHDLKTPLRNITSFLGLAERRLDEAGRAAVGDYLTIAAVNARQMHSLVTDVLEFSKLDSDVTAESESIDLEVCISAVVRRLPPEQTDRVEVRGAGASVLAPRVHVEQLVLNLIENGLKYNDSPEPLVTIEIEANAASAVLTVRDNGIGIAPEFHERVFGMFKRLHTTDEYQGTGLGLAVCRKVVERLGGAISLSSEVGAGTTFTVVLPASQAAGRPSHRHAEVA